ncbi:MFS transporter, DHA1 family, bicyclomycin/chloramphenicol resistance protein [Paracoccus isoporae]|uniref:MFS transporter, DHA1 family, bicyclomycin/chloramphenicol resistance protein n=1 Tax=Paracoccus isoporae TaxID=591205 RepID=A0A1G6XQI8_9RHOB|nr:multidrug effflux MFS transporter [Paracoccus isoporae]SDD79637.1 MFS transporter, DHA1 family, bicyclomycin/chloramphenicol resistance protein [Paracoccus isoporae]
MTSSEQNLPDAASARKMPLPEFVAMLAVLFATVAFSIDAMLPALSDIAVELSPDDLNRAQLVLMSFMAGMGTGTACAGPVSDAIGRRRTIMLGSSIYVVSSAGAIFADNLTLLLVLRFVQGFGASGPRIAGTALIRDLYSGREMARITSFVMMIFIMIPALAPALGELIIGLTGSWRGVFAAFIVFGLIGVSWVGLRQPETLPPERRVPLSGPRLLASAREVLGNRQVMLCTLILTFGFGQMFSLLASSEQLFGQTYGRADSFTRWFAVMALLSGIGTIANARYVMRFGMRRIARAAYAMQVVTASLALLLVGTGALSGDAAFYGFFAWAVSLFFMAGVTFGNLNALALQRMPHLAGMTASMVAALSSLGAVLIATPVGLAYRGTPVPVMLAALICSGTAWVLMRWLRE